MSQSKRSAAWREIARKHASGLNNSYLWTEDQCLAAIAEVVALERERWT